MLRVALLACLTLGLAGCGDAGQEVFVQNDSGVVVVLKTDSTSVLVPPGGRGAPPTRTGLYKDLEITVFDAAGCKVLGQANGFASGPILVSVRADRTVSMEPTERKDWHLLADTDLCG